MTGLIVTFFVVLALGVICVGSAAYFSMRERAFHARSRSCDAQVTGYTRDRDGRYHTQYRMHVDGHEIHGVLPASSSRPILPEGETLQLRVHIDDPTRVMQSRSTQLSTLRTFLYLLGIIMVISAAPLLIIAV
ncbi:DUF3592 domain-containing protein [Corynebacterium pacaense]|uniref:DUF3592 domain-containing protein n=1 Tax=Corynebacterium pacaense TaxID=1816684 RepID=UPI0009BA2D7E|nr:DUF3592 domain-containing protein [Corynebacterium pacaense]